MYATVVLRQRAPRGLTADEDLILHDTLGQAVAYARLVFSADEYARNLRRVLVSTPSGMLSVERASALLEEAS